MNPRLRVPAFVLTLAVLPFLVFWPLVTGAATLARGDFLEQNYPLRHLAIQGWAQGTLPLWNAHIRGGQPSLGDFLTCTFYPPNLLAGLITWPWGFPLRALEIEVMVHLAMAGIFAFLFAREVLRSDLGALAAGIIYALGGLATSYPMEQNHILESITWLPMILLFLELAFRRGGLLFYVGAGASLGICLLAGHPQIVLYMAFCFGANWLWRFARCRHAMHLAGLACMGLAAAAISLPLLLPGLEMIGQSDRAAMAYTVSAAGLAPQELWALLAPVHGGSASLYVGLAALVLMGIGLVMGRPRSQMLFWAAMALLSVLFALGGSGPLFPIVHAVVPGLGLMRQQERVLMIFALAAALLAGGGLAALEDGLKGRRAAALGLATLAAGAAGLWLASAAIPPAVADVLPRAAVLLAAAAVTLIVLASSRRGRAAACALLLAVLLADLASAPTHTALADAREAGPPRPDPVVAFLQKAANADPAFRVSSEGLLAGGPNAAVYFGLEDVVGSTTMTLATFQGLVAEVPEMTWWRLLNVRYVVTRRDLTHGALALVQRHGDVRLYELYGSRPRAWLVHRASAVDGPAEARRLLAAPDFPVDRRALVEGGPEVSSPTAPADVRVTELTPGSMRLQVQAGAPGYVLVSQNYYPGWLAIVDGRPSQVIRANGWQPAIHVGPGAHSILFVYAPFSLLLGLVLSLACVGGLVWMLRWLPTGAPACD